MNAMMPTKFPPNVPRQRSRSGNVKNPADSPTFQIVPRCSQIANLSITEDALNATKLQHMLIDLDQAITWLKAITPPPNSGAQLAAIVADVGLLTDEDVVRQHQELVALQAESAGRCGLLLAEYMSVKVMLEEALKVRQNPEAFRARVLVLIRDVRRRKAGKGEKGEERQSSGGTPAASRRQREGGGGRAYQRSLDRRQFQDGR